MVDLKALIVGEPGMEVRINLAEDQVNSNDN